ncbi:TfoX/Sxy family protein [Rubellimicrobium arenae]|uniref:TfoX/Sxy family protein n=1 Tax=Rubellimicrobium arenae TaxID=2817372 RepID=UPI001B303150|nr:TfoX/Sxy family protein [Rubellimicrobium arenae]
MARDQGLEEVLRDDLGEQDDLTEAPMFGGLAILHRGHLLCGIRHDGLMVRLGRGGDGWALDLPGVTPLRAGARPMPGWVRVPPDLCGDDLLRRRFLDAALAVTRALPPR